MAVSIGLHAVVIAGAWWVSGGGSPTPPEARFAAGEHAVVVSLRLREHHDADGPQLRYTAEAPTPRETHTPLPPMPELVQLGHPEPSAVPMGEGAALPVVELTPVVFGTLSNASAAAEPVARSTATPPPPAQTAGVQTEPKPVDAPPLRYPPQSRRRGEAGTVLLEALVNTDGSVTNIRVVRSPGYPLLEQAAREALRGTRFEPALHHGRPVARTVRIPFTFELKRRVGGRNK